MLTIKPFVSRALRRMGFDADYRLHAVSSWELEPACESPRLAAIFDEDDLNKVTGTAPHTTLSYQVEQLRAGSYLHEARRGYVFKNAVMVDGHLFTTRMVHPMAYRPLPGISTNRLPTVASGVLGTSEYGNKYFGHWFCDDVPLSLTAQQFGDVYGHVNSDNRLIGHQKSYAELLRWDVKLTENAHFRELTIIDWSPMTPFQGARFAQLRDRLGIDRTGMRKPGVMLLRRASGQRRILENESAIAEMARARGYAVLDPMESSVPELIKACSNADVVMGVEGSQLAHAFLPMVGAGSTLLTFQPPFKFDHFWKGRCDCIGARYAFIVGDQTDQSGFTIPTAKVERMLDRLAK